MFGKIRENPEDKNWVISVK